MTTYTWPTTRHFRPSETVLRIYDNAQRVAESPLSGDVQTLSMPGARWGWDITLSGASGDELASIEAFLVRLSGREHRVSLWDFKRPRPRGTCNTSGVTLNSTAAQFATTLSLAGCGASKTLLAGDWLGLSSGQVVMVVADATANGSGVMSVEVRQMLRAQVSSGASVTLEKPTALYVRTDSNLAQMRNGNVTQEPVAMSFVEVFS